MAENELQTLIKGIFSRIKEKYGYADEQALIYLKGYEDCAEEHQQSLEERDKMLRDTVAELCEAKRLLKMAVEDIHDVLSSQIKITNYTLCEKCKHYLNCNCKDKCMARYNLKQWRFADEALKLIGEDENET